MRETIVIRPGDIITVQRCLCRKCPNNGEHDVRTYDGECAKQLVGKEVVVDKIGTLGIISNKRYVFVTIDGHRTYKIREDMLVLEPTEPTEESTPEPTFRLETILQELKKLT